MRYHITIMIRMSYQEVTSYLAQLLQPQHTGVGDDPDGVGHEVNPLHGVAVLALEEDQPDQVYEREEDQGGRQDGLADVEEAPGDLTVAGPSVLAYLNTSHVGQVQIEN